MTTPTPEPTNAGLDNLAAQADALGTQTEAAAVPPIDPAQAQAEAQQQAMLQAVIQKLLMGVLVATRSRLARNLPELRQHWPDADLSDVAAAAFPVANKHMSRLMPVLGAYPEETMLAVAMLPLCLGYFAAIELHEAKAAAAAKAKAEAQATAPAAGPAGNVVTINGDQHV